MLLCNDLGASDQSVPPPASQARDDGQAAMSVKEAVRIAQANNFMGLVCRTQILVSLPLMAAIWQNSVWFFSPLLLHLPLDPGLRFRGMLTRRVERCTCFDRDD